MNINFLFFLFILMQATKAFGLDVEFRAAWLIPQDYHIQHVYNRGMMPDVELEISEPIELTCCDCAGLQVFGNISYYQKHGKSYVKTVYVTGDTTLDNLNPPFHPERGTKIYNWTINGGLKYLFCCDAPFQPYAGFGIGACQVRYQDYSIYVRREINLWGFCLLAKMGAQYELPCGFFFDLFADYSFNIFPSPNSKHNVGTRETNTGGLKLGAGLGYHF